MRGLMKQLGYEQKTISLHCDSQTVVHLSKHQVFHERSKHIDVRMHFVRDVIETGSVVIEKISTEENPANMCTKVIQGAKFSHCLALMTVISEGES